MNPLRLKYLVLRNINQFRKYKKYYHIDGQIEE